MDIVPSDFTKESLFQFDEELSQTTLRRNRWYLRKIRSETAMFGVSIEADPFTEKAVSCGWFPV